MNKKIVGIFILLFIATSINSAVGNIQLEMNNEVNENINYNDLIIDGNDVYIIENETFFHYGNIFVRDNAKLIIINAKLIITQIESAQYRMIFEGRSMLYASNAEISSNRFFEVSFDEYSKIELYDVTLNWFHAHHNADIFVYSSEIDNFHLHQSSTVDMVNCSTSINIGFQTRGTHQVSKLKPGFYESFDLTEENPRIKVDYNIYLTNTSVTKWVVENYEEDVDVTITDSILFFIACLDHSTYRMIDTTIDYVLTNDFNGDIIFENTTLKSGFRFTRSTVNIIGDFLILNDTSDQCHFEYSQCNREFNLFLTDSNGKALSNISLNIYNPDGEDIWFGKTDTQGKISFDITFDDNNFNQYWSITSDNDPNITRLFNIMTSSPIIFAPPTDPTIVGVIEGKTSISYDYTFCAYDVGSDDLYYYIDWGDDDNTGWAGPYDSGFELKLNHTWEQENNYIIKAKVKDVFGAESDWTTLEVTMPENMIYNPFIRMLQRLMVDFPLFEDFLQPLYDRLLNI